VRVIGHAALAMCCAALLGIGEGLLAMGLRDPAAVAAAAGGAGIVAMTALPFGLLQGAAAWLARRSAQRLGLSAWLARSTSDDPGAPREPVVRFHAAAVALLLAGAGAMVLAWILLAPLDPVADDVLRRTLTLGVFGGAALVALVAGALFTRLLLRPFAWLDARRGLPWPRSGGLRLLLYVALPLAAVLLPIWLRYRQVLGPLSLVIGVMLFLVGELILWLLWRWRRPARLESTTMRRWALGAAFCVAAAVAVVALRSERARAALSHASFSSASLALWNVVTDVDGDGFSSLFSNDCAPFDRSRHPLAWDIPDNGIDENCDGHDAVAVADSDQPSVLPRFSWSSKRGLEASGVQPRRYNVVWVIVDAVRADRVAFLGYRKPTTPYLSTLRKESLIFGSAYAQSSATMLSMPSMFTGRDPASMTWAKRRRLQPHPKHVTLAERLKKEGYRTGIVVDGYIESVLPGMTQGFDDVMSVWLDGKRRPWHEKSGTVATVLAIEWLERDRKLATPEAQPFFLLAYSSSPHDPYTRHPETGIDFGAAEMERYDTEIAFTDRALGFLIDYLKYRRPLWDDTLFVFTSDHGEEFGEHGGKIHAYTCYVESTHVPLLVRAPGLAGKRVDVPVGLIDIVPTLLQLLGLDEEGMQLDGQSLLAPAFAPDERVDGRPLFCAVLSQKAKQGNFFRRSVRVEDRVLLSDDVAGSYELYDTRADPGERRNLVDQPSEERVLSHLKRMLEESMTGNLAQSRLTK
jgi:arylsulfatase A-like enzyme